MLRYYKGFGPSDQYLSEPQQFTDNSLHYKQHFDGYKPHKFEYLSVRIPSNYHDYLVSQYGDYLEFPPEEKRVPCHNYVFVKFADGSILIEGGKSE